MVIGQTGRPPPLKKTLQGEGTMLLISGYEIGGTCNTYGGQERCIQSFGGETWGNETTWKTQA